MSSLTVRLVASIVTVAPDTVKLPDTVKSLNSTLSEVPNACGK